MYKQSNSKCSFPTQSTSMNNVTVCILACIIVIISPTTKVFLEFNVLLANVYSGKKILLNHLALMQHCDYLDIVQKIMFPISKAH